MTTLDRTEGIRRILVAAINSGYSQDEVNRAAELTLTYGDDVYTTETVSEKFTVEGFMAPFVVVRRKSDNKKGTLQFTHSPRFYFGWVEDSR